MKLLYTIYFVLLFVSCSSNSTENKNITQENEIKDTVPKVTGIGGIFFSRKTLKKREIGMQIILV